MDNKRDDQLHPVPDEKLLAEIATRIVNELGGSRLFEHADAIRLTKDLLAANLLQPPPAASKRCLKCGCANGVDANGWCMSGRPYIANQPDSNKHAICPCKCVFPAAGATTGHEDAIHWRLKAGVEETVCGLEVSDVKTTLLPDAATCEKCKVGFFGYKMGRADAATTGAAGGEQQWLTCAKCGNRRDMAGAPDSTFLCRYCFSTEFVSPAATAKGEGLEGNTCIACGEPIKDPYCDEYTEQYRAMLSAPPAAIEHPYFAHVKTCGTCGPSGLCSEGLQLYNSAPTAATADAAAQENPWVKLIGRYKDDPTWGGFDQFLQEYRTEIDNL